MVLDLRIAHERWGSSSDPTLNGNLHYPNDIDRSRNETAVDKIRKYLTDYNNNPPNTTMIRNTISFMSVLLVRLGGYSEFVRPLFLQTHRETDRFFSSSGVQLVSVIP